MKKISGLEKIKKDISTMRSEFQISEYLKENLPPELLADENITQELCQVSAYVKGALEIYMGPAINAKIDKEIEQVGLEEFIADGKKIRLILPEKTEELFNLAKRYEHDGEYEKAKEIYRNIFTYGKTRSERFNVRFNRTKENKDTKYYKSKFSYYICKVKNGEKLTPKDMEELENLVKDDKDNILNLSNPGKLTPIDYMYEFFDGITLEQLEKEILPKIPKGDSKSNNRGT